MRLDQFISQATDFSRSDAKRLIRRQSVSVDGVTATNPAIHIKAEQLVALNGKPLSVLPKRYYMVNKPKGYLCATADAQHPLVLDLLTEAVQKDKLQIAGRLDIDTTGLVLITDDGHWNHALTSPARQCTKVYRVRTEKAIDEDTIESFSRGLDLIGEKKKTRPAELVVLSPHLALLSICEGKYHQVKRMFAAMGNRVLDLHRQSVGAIHLDPDLEEGCYRALTPEEVDSVAKSSPTQA